jgi:hypothetical protein
VVTPLPLYKAVKSRGRLQGFLLWSKHDSLGVEIVELNDSV